MTFIETERIGLERNGETYLLILLGETHAYYLRKLLRTRFNLTTFYHFALIFDNNPDRESGIHRHITEIEIGREIKPKTFRSIVFPTKARLDISLDAFDRLRGRIYRRGETPFANYKRMEG